ncbi:MAG: hypothetical protein ACSLE0_08630 [Chitinophagaceae bacterium]
MKQKQAPGFLREYNSRQTPMEFKPVKYCVLDFGYGIQKRFGWR